MDSIIFFLDQNYIWVVLVAFVVLVKNEFDEIYDRAHGYFWKALCLSLIAAIFLLRHYGVDSFVLLFVTAMGIFGFALVATIAIDFIIAYIEDTDDDQQESEN